jgi:ABC-type sugar transport system substrate-binding protein
VLPKTSILRQKVASNKSNRKYDVTEYTANWSRSEGNSATNSFFSAGKIFDGIFAANDQMALGAIEAIRTSPMIARQTSKPIVIGFDAVPEAKAAVQDGTMLATLARDAAGMGVKGIQVLVDVWTGRPVKNEYLLPVTPILK